MKITAKKVSIIIPVHNEANYLEQQINQLITKLEKTKQIKYEVTLIENGSTDDTYRVAKDLMKKYLCLKVLRIKKPLYGTAIRKGIVVAKYNNIVQFDLDFIDVAFLKKVFILLENGYDIVVGSKLHPFSKDQRPFVRIFISKFINFFIRAIFQYAGSDTHGIKAYKKGRVLPLIKKIKSYHLFFDTEMLLRAQYLNFKIKEIPVNISELRKTRFPAALSIVQTIKEFINLVRLRKEIFNEKG